MKRNIVFLSICSILIGLSMLNMMASVQGFSAEYVIEPSDFAKTHIDLAYDKNNILKIHSNSSVDVLILNETEYGRYLAELPYVVKSEINDVVSEEIECNQQFVENILDLDYEALQEMDERIWFYIIIENNGISNAQVDVRINYESEFQSTLRHASNFAKIGFTLWLTVYLFNQSRSARKECEMERCQMSRGFGWTFLVASIAYISDTLNSWIPLETNMDFYPDVRYSGIFLGFIQFRFDQVVFLTLILVSDLFMIYEIEKVIANRTKPFMSYMLGVSILLNVITILVPQIIDIALLFYAVTLAITVFQVIAIYSKVIKESVGTIRYKSLAILIGFLIPLIMGFLGGELVPNNSNLSYTIANSINILSVFLVKYGLD